MKDLYEYTDDELRAELKRRAIEKRKNTPRDIKYVEFEATIKYVNNIKNTWRNQVWYNQFSTWTFSLKDCTSELANKYPWKDYKLGKGFNKSNYPKVGDVVKLRYRRTKKEHEVWDLSKAKIVEIIKKQE